LAIGPSARKAAPGRSTPTTRRGAICRRPGRVLQAALHRAGRRVVRMEGHKGSEAKASRRDRHEGTADPFGRGSGRTEKKPAFAISRLTRVARNDGRLVGDSRQRCSGLASSRCSASMSASSPGGSEVISCHSPCVCAGDCALAPPPLSEMRRTMCQSRGRAEYPISWICRSPPRPQYRVRNQHN